MARNARLREQVCREIRDRILAGEFPDNLKLPTESALSDRFGVSRSVVRAALDQLRREGLVETRRGSGSFVNHKTSDPSDSIQTIAGLGDLVHCQETRVFFEGEMAFLAAERRDDDDLKAIKSALDDMKRGGHPFLGTAESDYEFHIAVMAAAKNDFAFSLYKSIRHQIMVGLRLGRSLLPLLPEATMQNVIAEHTEVYNAIRDRDAPRARAAMRAHIDFFRGGLKKGDRW